MKKRKAPTLYMHTIDGYPATYEGPDGQVCFMAHGRTLTYADSLHQLRREQRASVAWRKAQGFEARPGDYSYLRFRLPSKDGAVHE